MIANGRSLRGPRHPSRWRPFTWFVIDVESFLAGAILGFAFTYNLLLPPLDSNEREGAGGLGIGLVFLSVFLSVVLGLAWVVSAIVAMRRRREEPVRRWIWLGAPIALIVGALLAGGPCLSSYRT